MRSRALGTHMQVDLGGRDPIIGLRRAGTGRNELRNTDRTERTHGADNGALPAEEQ